MRPSCISTPGNWTPDPENRLRASDFFSVKNADFTGVFFLGLHLAQVFALYRVLFRKNTGDLCALARFALQLNRAMMILHGVLYDGQAQPGSA